MSLLWPTLRRYCHSTLANIYPESTLDFGLSLQNIIHTRLFSSLISQNSIQSNVSSIAPLVASFRQHIQDLSSPGPQAARNDTEGRVTYMLRTFKRSGLIRQEALVAANITDDLFNAAFPKFFKHLLTVFDQQPDIRTQLGFLSRKKAHNALLQAFIGFTNENYSDELRRKQAMVKSLDLRHPQTWFPIARSLKRKIIYHQGQTNSGKTFNAVQAMCTADRGVYCGPLRLLAMEIFDSCNAQGVLCNLLTGQDRKEVPGAAHVACTVEMASLTNHVDVAVIDEIQLIGDEQRGFAWTRALLGIPANEVHVCGDGSALELVTWICQQTGEELEVKSYDRFTKLRVEDGVMQSYSSVQPGDCIVAFSKRSIFKIKAEIESSTKHKCCVVYGGCPPEVRRKQAKLFNDPDNEYSIMVASDAVGMGLNLNIRRVIFHSILKTTTSLMDEEKGTKVASRHPISTSAIKQIAGRAGRKSSEFLEGLVTCRNKSDRKIIKEALETPLNSNATSRAGLVPEFEQFEAFVSQRPGLKFSTLLEEFEGQAVLRGRYFFGRQEALMSTIKLLDTIEDGLTLKDRYTFAMAPASTGDPRVMAALLHWSKKYAAGLPCLLGFSPPDVAPQRPEEMWILEAAHNVVTLWLWLSYRFDEETFPNREHVEDVGNRICDLLNQGLENITTSTKNKRKTAGRSKPSPSSLTRNNKKTIKERESMYNKLFDAFKDELKLMEEP